jgi:hypothetical protein
MVQQGSNGGGELKCIASILEQPAIENILTLGGSAGAWQPRGPLR